MQKKLQAISGLPCNLKEAAVSKDSFRAIATAALNDGSIVHNPEEVDFDDAMMILEKAYE
jgi:alcohol dehydrogenase class IV